MGRPPVEDEIDQGCLVANRGCCPPVVRIDDRLLTPCAQIALIGGMRKASTEDHSRQNRMGGHQ